MPGKASELLAESGIISKLSFCFVFKELNRNVTPIRYVGNQKNMDYEAIINHIQSNANRLIMKQLR
ncbi:MAG: hypothetical protein ACLSCV_12605 [Acutalibacteraceae bacterium]